MSGLGNPRIIGVIAALIFVLTRALVPVAAAQETGQMVPPGPLASRLDRAKSVFVSNAKGENAANEKPRNDQAGTDFYAAMKSWHRYRLAPAATDADLLLQISLDKSQVRLTILDPSTHTVLASLIEPVAGGFFLSTRERNINQAVSALVDDLRRLTIEHAASVPPIATSAKPDNRRGPKVFLSNVGSYDDVYSGAGMRRGDGWSQAFNKFYAAMQSSGQYALVSSPAEADFVFEMSYTDPEESASKWRDKPGSGKHPKQEKVTYTIYHPQLRLVILDSRTLAVEGAFNELIRDWHRQADRDRAFAAAMNVLVNDTGRQLGRPPMMAFVPSVVNDAPVPPQIEAAKTVFISNTGTVEAYNKFYATMKRWGGYQLSSTTTGADLILEISQADLVILDPQTNIPLWSFAPEVKPAILSSHAEKNLDEALVTLVQGIAKLAGRSSGGIAVPQDVKDAPLPAQINAAKTVFISNAGGEKIAGGTGNTEQAYSDFYATMKNWGRFELVPTATEADLVFQISLSRTRLQLIILDPETHATLWVLNQNVRRALLSSIDEYDFREAMAALVKGTAKLAGQPKAEISVPAGVNTAPVPSRISDAQKVFLSQPTDNTPGYTREAGSKEELDQLYNQIYTGMKSWGKYELTATPAEADLIFDLSGPQITIRDAKTRHVLWTLNQSVKFAFLSSHARRNLNDAVHSLLDDMHRVAALSAETSHANTARRE